MEGHVKVNANKRVYGYLVDSLWIGVLTISATTLARHPLAGSVVNLFAFVLRDAVLPTGSPGKRLAGLRIDGQGHGWLARVRTSALRNLTLTLPLTFFLLPFEVKSVPSVAASLLAAIIFLVEYVRILRHGGVRVGDQLARDRVVELKPGESAGKYLGLSVLVAALIMGCQLIASLYLYPMVGERP